MILYTVYQYQHPRISFMPQQWYFFLDTFKGDHGIGINTTGEYVYFRLNLVDLGPMGENSTKAVVLRDSEEFTPKPKSALPFEADTIACSYDCSAESLGRGPQTSS